MTPREATIAAYEEAPPRVEVHERHFGNIVFAKIDVDSLLDLSQMRDKLNPQYEAIKESIDQEDLDNPINIARLDQAELHAYITFTNNTWNAQATVADFEPLRQADGRFNVVVAGHNRSAAIRAISAEHEESTGMPSKYTVLCKVMQDNSVGALVSKQASENLHATVPQERAAMALVELYYYGIDTGKWTSPDEFKATQGKRVNRRMVQDALAFAELPSPIRNIVLGGYLSYKVGVELGKAAPTIRTWFALRAGLEPDTVNEDVTASLNLRLTEDASQIKNHGWNPTAAMKYIEAYATKMQREIDEMSGISAEELDGRPAQAALFTMKSPAEAARELRRWQERQTKSALLALQAGPSEAVAKALQYLTPANGGEIFEGVIHDTTTANQILQKITTRRVLGASAVDHPGLTLVVTPHEEPDLFGEAAS